MNGILNRGVAAIGAAAALAASDAKAQLANLGPNAYGAQKVAMTGGRAALQMTNGLSGATKVFSVATTPTETNANKVALALAKDRALSSSLPREFYAVPPQLQTNNVALVPQAAFVDQGQIIFALEKNPTGSVFTKAQPFNGTLADFNNKLATGILDVIDNGELGQLTQPFIPADLSSPVITPAVQGLKYNQLTMGDRVKIYTIPGLPLDKLAAIMAQYRTGFTTAIK